jgi:peptidase M28-like protein
MNKKMNDIIDDKMTANQISHQKAFIMTLCFAFVLIACNLGGSQFQAPPTLAPRASATPRATLGFEGTGQQALNLVPGTVNTAVTSIDRELFDLLQQVDISRLQSHVEALQSFTTRHVNSAQDSPSYGIGAARDYIYGQFEQIAQQSSGRFAVSTQEFDLTYEGLQTRQTNVFGVLNGTVPGGGFVIIGAHYDSINTDFTDTTGFAPGANDNASGVSGLIEMARVLSQRQYRSSIIFVAFSAEEIGRVGSKAFVGYVQSIGLDVVGMINLDAIGNSNNRSGLIDESLRIFSCESEAYCQDGGLSRHMARSLEFLGFAHKAALDNTPLADSILDMRVEQQGDRDRRFGDQFSFVEAGYPAIRFINKLEEFGNGSRQDIADNVEWGFLQKSVRSIVLVTIALADGPPPPRSIVLRNNDEGRPTLIWEEVPDAASYVIALRAPGSTRYDFQLDWSSGTNVTWEGFTSGQYEALAIGTRGANGLIGRLSQEYRLR